MYAEKLHSCSCVPRKSQARSRRRDWLLRYRRCMNQAAGLGTQFCATVRRLLHSFSSISSCLLLLLLISLNLSAHHGNSCTVSSVVFRERSWFFISLASLDASLVNKLIPCVYILSSALETSRLRLVIVCNMYFKT